MTVRYARTNGVRLEWDVTGSGPELVYLHGLSGNLEVDRRLCERLGRHFTVMWYSARGHGRSTAPSDRHGWDYTWFAADLDAMIDIAGLQRPFLVGGSHGANTVLRHAVEHPGRAVAGAAVIAPGGNALRRPPRLHFLLLQAAHHWAMRKGDDGLVSLITGMEPGAHDADPVTVQAARTHDFSQLRKVLRHVPDRRAVTPERLADIDLPCIVSGWRGDPIIHPDRVAKRVASLLPGARFERIERLVDRSADDLAEYATRNVCRWYTLLTGHPLPGVPAP